MRINNFSSQPIQFRQPAFMGKNYAEYLLQRQKLLSSKHKPTKYWTLDNFDMEKLDGIQKDLKVLGNLSMSQIKNLTIRNLSIMLKRGCNNMCAHCYANARPKSFFKKDSIINEVDFDDFKNFCDDVSTLNKRMGFNIFSRKKKPDYQTLFHDADSSMIFAKDKNGKEYDYLDLAEMLHNATGKTVLFDTSGWHIQDKKTQQRMEALIKKFNSDPEKYKFMQFNVSVNPFQSLNYNAILRSREGKPEIAQRLRDAYITRLANTISTFMPIILDNPKNFNTISRCFDELENASTKGFQVDDLAEIYNETLAIVLDKFVKDYNIKSQKTVDSFWAYFQTRFENTDTYIVNTGMVRKNFNLDHKTETLKESRPNATDAEVSKQMNAGLIDLNGKFYLTNYNETFPTNIQLNYANKDKATAPINPDLNERIIKL